MKHTDKDRQLFDALNKSKMGTDLTDFLNRLMIDMCDVRNHKDDDESKVAKVAAKRIQDEIVDKIQLRTEMKTTDPEVYV